ncbi:MAG: hypothetical protein GX868_04890 [Actinobacteria bacterium]|nr:hypothetical protein [Actinomycetota bacterium]
MAFHTDPQDLHRSRRLCTATAGYPQPLPKKETTMLPWLPTGDLAEDDTMAFEITFLDRTTHLIADADTFNHDKSMTTFYRTGNARGTIDCWSTPVASIRTDEILMVRAAELTNQGVAEVRHLATA